MKLTPVEIFRAMNGTGIQNVKDCDGQIISPVAFHTHQYTDQDGKEHNVLVIKDGKTNEMFRTEVQAFIRKFLSYDEAFGSLADDQKPDIVITNIVSKKGNRYANFDVVDPAE